MTEPMKHITVEEARALANWLMLAAHTAERAGHDTLQPEQLDELEGRARAALDELAAARRPTGG